MTAAIPRPHGIEEQGRPVALVVLADTSGSMTGEPISILNSSLATMVQDLQSDTTIKDLVHLVLITFDDTARIVVPLTPISQGRLPQLQANGMTAMGAAFKLAESELADTSRITSRWTMPVIALCSDGKPNDPGPNDPQWEQALHSLKSHERVQQANRVALAIGSAADLNVLRRFIDSGNPEEDGPRLVEADKPERIKEFFRLLTFLTKVHTKTQGKQRSIPIKII
jgi:uncharacterized protein YegL